MRYGLLIENFILVHACFSIYEKASWIGSPFILPLFSFTINEAPAALISKLSFHFW